MQISSNVASTLMSRSLKPLSAFVLTIFGLFCGSSPVSATPLLGSALANFAVLGKGGVSFVPKGKISGNLGPSQNVFIDPEYILVTYSSIYTWFRPDISYLNSIVEPVTHQPQLDVDEELKVLNHPLVDIGSYLTGPILPVTGFESSGSFDQPVNVQSVVSIPEPATWALLGLGFAGLGFARRRYG